ncbi:MAG: sarcosine oxidase subunit gamma [Acidimicrobiia bacterium]
MAESTPIPSGVVAEVLSSGSGELAVSDASVTLKWRVFGGYEQVRPGTSQETSAGLVWSVSPGEWTVLGPRPEGEVVDLTHVRAMFRLTGADSARLMSKLCALDLGPDMFPDGAAARTLFAGVATELVRQDDGGVRSYLIVPSRSFGRYIHETILDAGQEFGL